MIAPVSATSEEAPVNCTQADHRGQSGSEPQRRQRVPQTSGMNFDLSSTRSW